jgi:hypothetical protein
MTARTAHVALGDLLLHHAFHAVIEIEMVPAIPLRHPDNLLAVIHRLEHVFELYST